MPLPLQSSAPPGYAQAVSARKLSDGRYEITLADGQKTIAHPHLGALIASKIATSANAEVDRLPPGTTGAGEIIAKPAPMPLAGAAPTQARALAEQQMGQPSAPLVIAKPAPVPLAGPARPGPQLVSVTPGSAQPAPAPMPAPIQAQGVVPAAAQAVGSPPPLSAEQLAALQAQQGRGA